jgi:hypothetical protein
MCALRVPRRLWLDPDWSNWVLMTTIAVLAIGFTAFAFYFYVLYAS